MKLTFFLGHVTLVIGHHRFISAWRKYLFGFLSHNARDDAKFFHLPPTESSRSVP